MGAVAWGGGAPWGFGGGARAEGHPLTLSLAPRELDLTLQVTLSVMVTLLYLDLKGRGNLEYANRREMRRSNGSAPLGHS